MTAPTERFGETVMPETDPAPSPEQPDTSATDSLGDAGKKALAAEREARKAVEAQLKQATLDLTAAKEQNGILQAANSDMETAAKTHGAELTRWRVGVAKGLPESLIDRLRGDDQAALEADADLLLAAFPHTTPAPPVPGVPRPDRSQGSRTPAPADPAAEFAALFRRT